MPTKAATTALGRNENLIQTTASTCFTRCSNDNICLVKMFFFFCFLKGVAVRKRRSPVCFCSILSLVKALHASFYFCYTSFAASLYLRHGLASSVVFARITTAFLVAFICHLPLTSMCFPRCYTVYHSADVSRLRKAYPLRASA